MYEVNNEGANIETTSLQMAHITHIGATVILWDTCHRYLDEYVIHIEVK
jgi:hypothetical protein